MSTQLSGSIAVAAQGLLVADTNQNHNLGELVHANDGRAYRYCKAGGSALVAGTLQQAPAEDTGDQNIAATTAAVGDTSITTATMTVTANQYAQGWVLVTVTPGLGLQYQIKGHSAYTSAAATFNLVDPILVALTSTSRLDFIPNLLNGVVINPTAATSAPVGVAVTALASASFGWLQVAGVASILNDGGSTVGTAVVASNGTAGAVEALTGTQAIIGTAVSGIATTENGAVKLLGVL